MKLTATKIKRLIKRKLATAVLVAASLAAFATFVDDGGKKGTKVSTSDFAVRSFSLRTPYNYKSNNLFTSSKPQKFIMLNTVVTYQKGNATYILPLKKKVLLDKIKFNPTPSRF
jgi:hypothetical protein